MLTERALEDADRTSDLEREPAGAQLAAALVLEIARAADRGPTARGDPAHRERDRDAEVVALGEAEHRYAERAIARRDGRVAQPRVLVAEHDRERRHDVDVIDGVRRAGQRREHPEPPRAQPRDRRLGP